MSFSCTSQCTRSQNITITTIRTDRNTGVGKWQLFKIPDNGSTTSSNTTNVLCPLLCRLLKPRPQFSSCAAFAFTCPRTSWPAGVWETSRITSAHTCQIKASCSTQPHREKPFPSLLPKPSEANWCTHLHPFPFKRCELVLGSLLFCYLLVLPSLTWSWISFHPCFSPHAPNVPLLLSAIFGLVPPFCFVFFVVFLISLPLHSLLLTHPVLFIWTCTNIDFEWLVVLLEPHCQQHRSLKELFMLHQSRNKQYTCLHGGSQMDVFLYPCCHKKGLLKLVCNVNGVSRTTLHNLLTKGQVCWPNAVNSNMRPISNASML